MAYEPWQIEEIKKCKKSFSYFTAKYVKITHPMKGLIPFKLYGFQERVIQEFEDYQYNIIRKFRQGGLTTVSVIWALWRCLFKTDQRIMVVCKTDRESIGIGKIVQNAKVNLPEWMQPQMKNDNDREKEFADTGGVIWFYTPQGVRSRALTYLIIDEAAFIPNMHEHWKALYPSLAAGGKCIAISTVNGIGNWYEETYTAATEKKNQFHVIDLSYKEHPDYNNEAWVKRTRQNLGEKNFLQEILGSFLGSGETYIEAKIISELERQTIEPIRKLFPDWDSTRLENWEEQDLPNEDYEKGALWVWGEPIANKEYLLCVDASEGVGDEGDFSAFNVLDTQTLEQVAEFYSNCIQPHKFAQVINEVAQFYNTALVVIENDTGPGLSVLGRLEHNLYYENLYFTQTTSSRERAGFTINRTSRPVVLETLQTCLMNNLVTIHSSRFVKELKTFIWNKQKQRAEAQKQKHDDLVMALSIGLYISDVMSRNVPLMGTIKDEMPKDLISEVFRGSTMQKIRAALEEGLPDDFFDDDEEMEEVDLLPKVIMGDFKNRKNDRFLKEFGW